MYKKTGLNSQGRTSGSPVHDFDPVLSALFSTLSDFSSPLPILCDIYRHLSWGFSPIWNASIPSLSLDYSKVPPQGSLP